MCIGKPDHRLAESMSAVLFVSPYFVLIERFFYCCGKFCGELLTN